ncbi:MAG: hypothetical protein FWC85_02675, partial [Elusimicrobia bacterium]|nr:hypothetical protein [Elusimicrobiota bacterium]
MLLGKINFKKAVAIVVINCFLFSFVYGNAVAQAFAGAKISPAMPLATTQLSQMFNNITLPPSYGRVTDMFITNSPYIVVQIQDLHSHSQAQKNIANILGLIDRKLNNNLETVFLEGAFGDVDTSWLSDFTQANTAELSEILNTGRLTGAEYFSALTGRHALISGIESKAEYLDNIKRFGEILNNQTEILAILDAIEYSTQELQRRYFSRQQNRIENLFARHQSGVISTRRYYALLLRHIERLGINLSRYENTSLYIQLLQKERTLNERAISRQLQSFIQLLRQKLPYSAYRAIVNATNNFSQADRLYAYLATLTEQLNLDLSQAFPDLNRFFEYVKISQKINPVELINEEQSLRAEINTHFARTQASREVVFLINFNRYLRNFLTSKITAKDYKYYKANIDKYRMLWAKHVDNRVLSLLEPHIARAEKFYAINTYRDEIFVRNLGINSRMLRAMEASYKQSPPRLSQALSSLDGKNVKVMITGGFHTKGISQILKDKNVSYIVITPGVTGGLAEAFEIYHRVARAQAEMFAHGGFDAFGVPVGEVTPASQAGIQTSALANVILSIDSVGRTAFVNALNNNLDLTAINVSVSTQAQNVQGIIREIQKAKIIESDNYGELNELILTEIRRHLPHMSQSISPEILNKLNLEQVRHTLNNNISRLEAIIESAINPQTPLQVAIGRLRNFFNLGTASVVARQQIVLTPDTDTADLFKTGDIVLTPKHTFLIDTGEAAYIMAAWMQGPYLIIEQYTDFDLEQNRPDKLPDYTRISKEHFDELTGLEITVLPDQTIKIINHTENVKIAEFNNQHTINYYDFLKFGEFAGIVEAHTPFLEPAHKVIFLDSITAEDFEYIFSGGSVTIYPSSIALDGNNLSPNEIAYLYKHIIERAWSLTNNLTLTDPQTAFNIKELVKNAFVHGNHLAFNKPIFVQTEITVTEKILNVFNHYFPGEQAPRWKLALATDRGWAGSHRGEEMIARQEHTSFSRTKITINSTEFTKASIIRQIQPSNQTPAQVAPDTASTVTEPCDYSIITNLIQGLVACENNIDTMKASAE